MQRYNILYQKPPQKQGTKHRNAWGGAPIRIRLRAIVQHRAQCSVAANFARSPQSSLARGGAKKFKNVCISNTQCQKTKKLAAATPVGFEPTIFRGFLQRCAGYPKSDALPLGHKAGNDMIG